MTSKMGRLILLLSLLVLSLAAVCPTVLAAGIDEPEPILCELTRTDIGDDDDDYDMVGNWFSESIVLMLFLTFVRWRSG